MPDPAENEGLGAQEHADAPGGASPRGGVRSTGPCLPPPPGTNLLWTQNMPEMMEEHVTIKEQSAPPRSLPD